MTQIITAEAVSALFMGISLVFLYSEHNDSKSARMLKINVIIEIVWLLTDMASYKTGFAYIPTLLTFSMGGIALLFYTYFCEAYIAERTSLSPWTFRVTKILSALCVLASAVSFLAGKTVVYENGAAAQICGNPLAVQAVQTLIMLYNPAASFTKRKAVGLRSVVLLTLFSLGPVFGMIAYTASGSDYTVVISAVALMLIIIFLYGGRRREDLEAQIANRALTENNIRILALEDNFVSLYDVCLENGNYVRYDRDDFYRKNISAKPVSPAGFFDTMRENIDRTVLEEDRESTRLVQQKENIVKGLSQSDHIDHFYRVLSGAGPVWMKMRIVYKNAEKKNVIIGIFNAQKEVEARQIEEREQLRETEEAEKLLESVAGVYRFAFAVDMAGSYFKVIRMDEEVRNHLKTADFVSYGDAIAPLFTMLHPADRERMHYELDFDTVREKLKETPSYNVEYRVLVDGAAEWHEMNVTHIIRDEIAMGFGEKDLEITKRHIDRIRFNEYFGLYEADLDTGLFKVIIDSPYYTFSETGKPVPYSPAMKTFAESQTGETKEFFLKLADTDWVIKTLSADDRHSFTYHSITAGNSWVDVTCYVTMRHDDGSPAMFVLGFNFVSSLEAARQEIQRHLNESSHMISGLASGYESLYYVNIDEGLFTVYSLDGEKFPQTSRIVKEGKDPFEMLRTFGASALVCPQDRYLFRDMSAEQFRQRLAGQKRFSLRFRRAAGDTYVWNEMNVVKYEDTDEQANAIVIGFADCDEEIRKELERQKQLSEALAMAEVANRAKTDFLFNMSHDIRTPMNAIIGFTNIAKKEIRNPEKALDSLDKVQRSSDILLSLINDVLDMSRIESGKAELHEEKQDIGTAFDSIAPAMANLAASKEIDLRFSVGDVRDRYVYADGPRFDRVLINIISNAIKYTLPGGFVKVSAEQLADTEPGRGNYRFTVTDSGIGMSEEFQKHMFEDFAREENSTTSGIQGTGLGLSLAKKLVDMMGGTISCVSSQGVGTTFRIVLPFRLRGEETAEEPVGQENSADIDLNGKKALLVEDNELNREIAQEILCDEGITVETAENGQKAVNMVRERGEAYYDFILMDIQMPVMDGYEATRTIRRLMPELKTPIIALSANAFAEDKRKSLEAGMDDHVAKPINVKALVSALARHEEIRVHL